MVLETCMVSAKTQGDGKLEVSPDTADRLRGLGASFGVRVLGRSATARLSRIVCTCGKRSGGTHVHDFVESPLLKELPAGGRVQLILDGMRGELSVEVAADPRRG